jgi:hypothetical protein
MSNKVNLDQVRSAALNRIERSERNFKLAIYTAVAWEAVFLIAFIFGMERHNQTHMLLLISTVGIYTIVLLGLVALGAHVSRNTQRILRAIELLEAQPANEAQKPSH